MDDRLARIGRLAAVARGLEREGAYNGAKLLRAALASDLVRHAEATAPSGSAAAADALTQLPDDLLLLTDKMSMAVSLECRVPLLDHQLVELAASMPAAADAASYAVRKVV